MRRARRLSRERYLPTRGPALPNPRPGPAILALTGLAVGVAGGFARAAIWAWVANHGRPQLSIPVITRRSIRSR